MDLRDFLHRRCSELLVLEREGWQLNGLMAQESWQPELKRLFERHNAPLRQQISNLEQIVDELGGIIGPLEHPVTQAVRRLHRQFLELNPPQALVEINNALEAEKLAQWTATASAGLAELARQLGEEGFQRLLESNHHRAEEMRAALAQLRPTLVTDLGEQLRRAA